MARAGITNDIFIQINPKVNPEGFIYRVPEWGNEEDDEEEDPILAPSIPPC